MAASAFPRGAAVLHHQVQDVVLPLLRRAPDRRAPLVVDHAGLGRASHAVQSRVVQRRRGRDTPRAAPPRRASDALAGLRK